jgi:hypothetical protein
VSIPAELRDLAAGMGPPVDEYLRGLARRVEDQAAALHGAELALDYARRDAPDPGAAAVFAEAQRRAQTALRAA